MAHMCGIFTPPSDPDPRSTHGRAMQVARRTSTSRDGPERGDHAEPARNVRNTAGRSTPRCSLVQMPSPRLERGTYCLGGSRSIHLSYEGKLLSGHLLRLSTSGMGLVKLCRIAGWTARNRETPRCKLSRPRTAHEDALSGRSPRAGRPEIWADHHQGSTRAPVLEGRGAGTL